VGVGSMEIRPLSALLPSGLDHLEPAILSSVDMDAVVAEDEGDALPLRALPVQLRELSPVPGKIVVEKAGVGDADRSQAVAQAENKNGSK
jgi:hypothetical protein